MTSTTFSAHTVNTVTRVSEVIVPGCLIIIDSTITLDVVCPPYCTAPIRLSSQATIDLNASLSVAEAMRDAEGHFRYLRHLAQVSVEQAGPHAPVLLPVSMTIRSQEASFRGVNFQRYQDGQWEEDYALIPPEQWRVTQEKIDFFGRTCSELIRHGDVLEAADWQGREAVLADRLRLSRLVAGEPA
ncbi:hypothetical protein QCD60_30275 [Pokkaliibacter sp. MBI-7]|uniref:hypothetical protein n=1 Tax=Pokkaliibacter sp. MBI-7 TaxID=3040600 RepID=UPI002449F089|nr:hypothetical protein [Pokkaliibacter sp. MBI-7]MDH2431008.1 hypothetical protein [Pokkaliibacter sp. MBI-7]MDH2436703.1 hypothetical protein [Pokkaliibacter sp. MBI-7]MDH2436803.1 hypothetical protein [Pokkaliibacter sp. MBI-7]